MPREWVTTGWLLGDRMATQHNKDTVILRQSELAWNGWQAEVAGMPDMKLLPHYHLPQWLWQAAKPAMLARHSTHCPQQSQPIWMLKSLHSQALKYLVIPDTATSQEQLKSVFILSNWHSKLDFNWWEEVFKPQVQAGCGRTQDSSTWEVEAGRSLGVPQRQSYTENPTTNK